MSVALVVVLGALVQLLGALFVVDLLRWRWPWVAWSGVCFVASSGALLARLLGW